ncbi:MAG: hypothetical protein Q9174_006304 [Haloplaca sp. 1 TL-2023]
MGVPPILFRVLHDGGWDPKNQWFDGTPSFDDGHLLPRNINVHASRDHIDRHLSWEKEDTPYISMCTRPKARRVIQHLEDIKARNITLVAFDSSAFAHCVDAYHYAKWNLRYEDNNEDPRRRLRYHHGEWLVWGGYCADDYKLLIALPIHSLAPEEVEQEIMDEVSLFTGIRGDSRAQLLLGIMGAFPDILLVLGHTSSFEPISHSVAQDTRFFPSGLI